MLQVKNVCTSCGTSFMVDIDAKDKNSLCPAPNCYGKKTECYKCDEVAKFTQPDKDTGEIIDVCEKHFSFKHWG